MSSIVSIATDHAQRSMLFVGILGAVAGLMFGLDIGVIAGAVRFIKADFAINDHTVELIVSSMMLGAAIGALGSGWLSKSLGRKRSLMIGGIVFVIGAILSALSVSPTTLIGSRLILGLAIGVLTFTAPLYLAELAPKRSRGALISIYQLMTTVGLLVAFLSDTAFSSSGNWRWMLGVITIPGIFFSLGLLIMPESPRWLLMKGRKNDATRVLARLRREASAVHQELIDIERQLLIPRRGWQMFLRNSNFRRSVGLGILLQAIQQLTGINVVNYYAPRVFSDMGYAPAQQMQFTVLIGIVAVLSTFIAIGLVDRWGRKPILYVGFSVMLIGLGTVGSMMSIGTLTHDQQFFTVAMLLVFIVGFSMSAGPIIWILCSEIQPLKGRDFGICCSTVTNWVVNMIVGATFLSLLDGLGNAGTFWLYAGFNLIALVLIFLLVPETRGVTLEQIERRLMAGKRLRNIGRED